MRRCRKKRDKAAGICTELGRPLPDDDPDTRNDEPGMSGFIDMTMPEPQLMLLCYNSRFVGA